ncbi:MAG: hypothetical protein OYG32_01470 [Rhodospirillaceae bacterium]|nr:hypothetical protein [Rhodospirillaceae bacterium]
MRDQKFNSIHLRYEDERGGEIVMLFEMQQDGRIMHEMTQACLLDAQHPVKILCKRDGLEFGSGNATQMAAT